MSIGRSCMPLSVLVLVTLAPTALSDLYLSCLEQLLKRRPVAQRKRRQSIVTCCLPKHVSVSVIQRRLTNRVSQDCESDLLRGESQCRTKVYQEECGLRGRRKGAIKLLAGRLERLCLRLTIRLINSCATCERPSRPYAFSVLKDPR